MKIKVVEKSYADVMALPVPKHCKPRRIDWFFRTLIKVLSVVNLRKNHVKYREIGMERLAKGEPCLILMNHSGFVDMEIAGNYLYPRAFSTVCTHDAYVGMAWLMRTIGCIPTQKFVSDVTLIRDMNYALKELKTTVLMYPEACYSFDGRANALPDSIGGLLKLLKVPVVTMITHGAYTREPLYNMLRHRKVDICTDVTYLLSPEEIRRMTQQELNERVQEAFSFDSFRWQRENEIHVTEAFRAEGLERVLYKCPHCHKERTMKSAGSVVGCAACGKMYELTELGALEAVDGEGAFDHVPDWYSWEREEVKKELAANTYRLDCDVEIYMMVDFKAIYRVGEGRLRHDAEGFLLEGADGELSYSQSPLASYTVNSDFYWYERGDVISIGNKRHLFFCLPKDQSISVAKVKMAAEELYKLRREEIRHATE